ncbi:MAG: hypothetical protein WCP35_03725 [Verrucomicrobiota bacterium]
MSQPESNEPALVRETASASTIAGPRPAAGPPAKATTGNRRPVPSQIVFYSYPKFLYTWPVIFLAVLLPLLGINPQVEGWIFVISLLTVLMAMGFDLSRNLTISWGAAILASIFCLLWLKDAKHVVVFGQIGQHLSSKVPLISHDWLNLFGLFGGILYFIMFIDVRINQRWRISHNEIEHFAMLSKDDSLGRGAKRFITSYPDFLELLLCGAGTIQIYSAQGGIQLRSIPNVPWLFFRSARISQILESTEVSASSGEEDVDLHEGQAANEELGDGHGG